MSSKSKDVRTEQHRILEKKLDLRLQQLAQKAINKEEAQRDPLVKNLKAKIRETAVRIKAIDKFRKLNEDLAQAKAQKLIDLAKKEEAPETGASEQKPKKKSAAAEKEPKTKKKADGAADGTCQQPGADHDAGAVTTNTPCARRQYCMHAEYCCEHPA